MDCTFFAFSCLLCLSNYCHYFVDLDKTIGCVHHELLVPERYTIYLVNGNTCPGNGTTHPTTPTSTTEEPKVTTYDPIVDELVRENGKSTFSNEHSYDLLQLLLSLSDHTQSTNCYGRTWSAPTEQYLWGKGVNGWRKAKPNNNW